MRIDDLSPAQLRKFHAILGKKIGVKFVHSGPYAWYAKRAMAKLNGLVGGLLPNLPEKLRPMCIWRVVLLPWKPGASSPSPTKQVLIAVHEARHFDRMNNHYPSSALDWYREYFTRPKFRALEEASCWESEADVTYWYSGRVRPLNLDGYLLTAGALSLGHASYVARSKQLAAKGRGWTGDRVSAAAIDALQRLGVEAL